MSFPACVAPKEHVQGKKALPWCVCHHPCAQTVMSCPEDGTGDGNTGSYSSGVGSKESGGWTGALPHHLCKPLCLRKGIAAYFENTGIWSLTVDQAEGGRERKCRKIIVGPFQLYTIFYTTNNKQ